MTFNWWFPPCSSASDLGDIWQYTPTFPPTPRHTHSYDLACAAGNLWERLGLMLNKAMHGAVQSPLTKYLGHKASSVLSKNFRCKTKKIYLLALPMLNVRLMKICGTNKPCTQYIHLCMHFPNQSVVYYLSVCPSIYLATYVSIYCDWSQDVIHGRHEFYHKAISLTQEPFQKELFSHIKAFTWLYL